MFSGRRLLPRSCIIAVIFELVRFLAETEEDADGVSVPEVLRIYCSAVFCLSGAAGFSAVFIPALLLSDPFLLKRPVNFLNSPVFAAVSAPEAV